MAFRDELQKIEELIGEKIPQPVESYDGWSFGERVRVIEDDDREGLCAGDEGYLVLQTVGAAQYGNVRTDVGVLMDGYDSPLSTDLDNLEAA
jgi:hypothetical protein